MKTLFVFGACLVCLLMQLPVRAADTGIATQCRRDLEMLPAFLLANDAGGHDAWARLGEPHFKEALQQATVAMDSVTDSATCTEALRAYLKSWRAGHLGLYDKSAHAVSPQPQTEPPRVEWLSSGTALLVFPSFEGSEREAVERLIKQNRKQLARHRNWIIDVRGNGGGSDSTYAEILRWIGPASRVDVQPEYWATAANIDATRQACALVGVGDDLCEPAMRTERERMQSVPDSSWVLQQAGAAVIDVRQENREAIRPLRVAILIDERCASSCEEFLLAARQSFSVKLVGQHSQGTLDYSNLRPHTLPSGSRVLFYAVTRSLRIPAMPVDGVGVMPDVFVPASQAGIKDSLVSNVARWLAGGGLSGASGSPE